MPSCLIIESDLNIKVDTGRHHRCPCFSLSKVIPISNGNTMLTHGIDDGVRLAVRRSQVPHEAYHVLQSNVLCR